MLTPSRRALPNPLNGPRVDPGQPRHLADPQWPERLYGQRLKLDRSGASLRRHGVQWLDTGGGKVNPRYSGTVSSRNQQVETGALSLKPDFAHLSPRRPTPRVSAHPVTTTSSPRRPLATRAQQASSTADKAARAAALVTLTGERLPLPTDRRTEPAEYTDDLPAEIVALGAEGLTETQIADHLCLSGDGLDVMANAHQALKDALSRARTAAKAWWEEQARRALITENNRFPAGAWAQVMKARFPDYDDKPTIHIDLGSLVMIQRRAPEPLGERAADPAKPLIEGRSVRLDHSPTGQGSGETNLPEPDSGRPHHDGPDSPAEGG